MKEETASQNIKTQLKVSSENEKIEVLKSNQCMDNSSRSLKDHLQIK